MMYTIVIYYKNGGNALMYTYKGHHLVRNDNEIYYGNMSGEYVTKIEVQSTKPFKGENGETLEIADKLKILLLPTDNENFDISKIKTANRGSLYEALEVAHNWLVKAN